MSVYSGFASRTQETNYNRYLYNTLCLLQLKVTSSLRGGISSSCFLESFDDSALEKYFVTFYKKLSAMDEFKYLKPQFSYSVKDLASYYGIYDNNSSKMSRLNETNHQIQFSNSDTDPIFNETSSNSIHKSFDIQNKNVKRLYNKKSENVKKSIGKNMSLGRRANHYPVLPKPRETSYPRYLYKSEVRYVQAKPTSPHLQRLANCTSILNDTDNFLLKKNKKDFKTDMGNYSDLEVINENSDKKEDVSIYKKRSTPATQSRNWKESEPKRRKPN